MLAESGCGRRCGSELRLRDCGTIGVCMVPQILRHTFSRLMNYVKRCSSLGQSKGLPHQNLALLALAPGVVGRHFAMRSSGGRVRRR